MTRPLVHLGGKEVIDALANGDPLDVEQIQNLLGELFFADSLNPVPVPLSTLIGAGGGPAGEAHTSGLRNAGSGQLSILNSTTVRIAAGTDEVLVERQAAGMSAEHTVSWPQTDIVISGIANSDAFYIVQDPGFTGTGTILELSAPPSESDLRTPMIFLGGTVHRSSTLVSVFSAPNVYNDQGHLLNDLLRLAGGAERKSGQIDEIPATLTSSHTAVKMFGAGINFHNAPLTDPNNFIIPTSVGAYPFDTIRPDGTVFNTGVTVFPKTYNSGGVETALVGQRAAVHQIALGLNGQVYVQLGTTDYQNYQTAIESIGIERINNPLWELAEQYGELMGYCVISAPATQWEDGRAHIVQEAIGGGLVVGSGVTSLLQLSDTPDSYASQGGRTLNVNAIEDAIYFGKNRAQIMLPLSGNINASSGAVLDVVLPAHVNASVFHIENVHCEVKTAPGVDTEFDVRIAGVSIFSGSFPTIVGSANIGQLAPTTTDHFMGDSIKLDVVDGDNVWEDLTVTLEGWVEAET